MKTIAFALALPLAIASCASRNHLTPTQGQSYRQAVARQTVNPNAGDEPADKRGLDPQEAAVIAAGYRTSLAPKGDQVGQESMLLVAPSAQRAGGRSGDYMPPASVPQER